jgi:hypothetical protein
MKAKSAERRMRAGDSHGRVRELEEQAKLRGKQEKNSSKLQVTLTLLSVGVCI